MMHRKKVVLALMLPLVLTLSAAAQGTPTGTLYGFILDPDHRAVSGTRIVIESANSGETRDAASVPVSAMNRSCIVSPEQSDPFPTVRTSPKHR